MGFPKGLLLAHLTVFADSFGYAFIMPIIPFFATKLGGTSFELGLTISSYALFQTISVVAMGSLSDVYGRRVMLLLSLFGSFTGPLFQSFSWCMWAFIIFRGYTGLLGGSQTIGQAYIADVTTIEERPKYMAQQGAIISVAMIFGPAIGGLLSQVSLESPFWLASACALLVFVISIFYLQETNQKIIKKKELQKERRRLLKKNALSDEESVRVDEINDEIHKLMEKPKVKAEADEIHWNARMIIMVIARFFIDASCIIFDAMMGLYMKDNFGATSLDISGVQCVCGFLTLLVQLFMVPYFVKWFTLRITFIIGSVILTCGGIYMAYSNDLLSSYLSGSITLCGYSVLFPLIPTVLSTEAPQNSQGTVLSIGNMAGQLAQIIIPSVAGIIYEYSPFWGIMSSGISGICLVVLTLILFVLWGESNVDKYYTKKEESKDIEENKDKDDLQNENVDIKEKKKKNDLQNTEKESISKSSSLSPIPSVVVAIPSETIKISVN